MIGAFLLLSALTGGQIPLQTLDDFCQPDCTAESARPLPSAFEPPPGHRLNGGACYYSDFFDGRKTANGEIFRQAGMTAAHRTLPLGTVVEVTSRATGRTITVRVNDRGPYGGNFVIDLSKAAARALGVDRARDRHVDIRVVSMPSAGENRGKRASGSRR